MPELLLISSTAIALAAARPAHALAHWLRLWFRHRYGT